MFCFCYFIYYLSHAVINITVELLFNLILKIYKSWLADFVDSAVELAKPLQLSPPHLLRFYLVVYENMTRVNTADNR